MKNPLNDLNTKKDCALICFEIYTSHLTIHAREVQDIDPWRSYIHPCHDNRLFRTFLMIMMIVTHSPVPTITPPTILWVSVERYRLVKERGQRVKLMLHSRCHTCTYT